MGKKEEQFEQRKWQFFQIGLNEFVEKGFFGTSTRKIAEKAGISSGLLFHYFQTKEALYEALVEIGCTVLELEKSDDITPIELFEQKAEECLECMSRNDFSAKMFVFMGQATVNASNISQKANDMIMEHDITSQSVRFIEEGQRLGQIRSGDATALATTFFSCLQGVAEARAINPLLPLPDKEWIMSILKG